MRLRTGFFSASRFRMTGKQCHPERSDLPTRRDGRGASPMRAFFRSYSPPQTRSLLPPPAAVAYLPPSGHARTPAVERRSAGACPPTYGILRRFACPLVGIVVACRPKGLPSTPFLLRKTAPFLCHRQRSQFCPCTHGSALYSYTKYSAPFARVDVPAVRSVVENWMLRARDAV